MKSTVVGFISFFLILAVVIGCNEDGRHGIPAKLFDEPHFHKTLTILFDGVPPRGGEMAEEASADPNLQNVRKRSKVVWYIHEPQKDCVRCHGNRQQRTFSREVQLTAQVPELCYECHDSFVPSALGGWVHGPVATGECLFCHEPHKTKNPHLLKQPIPKLCYQCHEEMTTEESDIGHSERRHLMCDGCHQSHAGSTDHLKARTPELCYNCHEPLAPTALEGYVHGPVVVGVCLYCHEPHETEEQYWLREPIPELCYGCHDETSMDSVRSHSEEPYFKCNNCHESHASSGESLLKPDWKQGTVNEPNEPESASGASAQ